MSSGTRRWRVWTCRHGAKLAKASFHRRRSARLGGSGCRTTPASSRRTQTPQQGRTLRTSSSSSAYVAARHRLLCVCPDSIPLGLQSAFNSGVESMPSTGRFLTITSNLMTPAARTFISHTDIHPRPYVNSIVQAAPSRSRPRIRSRFRSLTRAS